MFRDLHLRGFHDAVSTRLCSVKWYKEVVMA
jgi:hypothetical protein